MGLSPSTPASWAEFFGGGGETDVLAESEPIFEEIKKLNKTINVRCGNAANFKSNIVSKIRILSIFGGSFPNEFCRSLEKVEAFGRERERR